MRDPDLVRRAERAAGALERAWDRWRSMHGLGSEPLAPVSSYVGYSMEEPWGQPRVVFGVAASEAEQLAALLDGHDCYGPVHAEVTGRPDWRRTPASDAGTSALPANDHPSIPLQARPPALDMLPPVTPGLGALEMDGTVGKPSDGESEEVEWRSANAARADAPIADVESAESHDAAEPGEQPKSSAAGSSGQTAPRTESAQARPQVPSEELAPLPPIPDPSPAGPMGSASLVPRKLRSRGGKPAAAPSYRAQRFSASPVSYEATQDPATSTPSEAGLSVDAAGTGVAQHADTAADAVTPDSAVAPDTVAAADTAAVSDAGPDTAAASDVVAAVSGAAADTAAPLDVADDTAAAAPLDVAGATDAAAPLADAAVADAATPGDAAAAGPAAPTDEADAADSAAAPERAVAKDAAKSAAPKSARTPSAPANRPTRARPRPPTKTNRTPR